jgi:hypothetical protein
MAYGLQTLHTDGTTVLLEISDRTVRLKSVTSITVPTSGTTTVSVSNTSNTGNAIAVTENGAVAQVTSTGVVTVYGGGVSGNTNLRVYEY